MEPGPVHARVRRRMHARCFDHVVPAENPGTAQPRQTVTNVGALRSARVVHAKRRLAGAKRNLAHRHAELAALDVHLPRIGKGGFEVGLLQRSEAVSTSHAADHSSQMDAGSAPKVCGAAQAAMPARNRFPPGTSSLRSAAHSARIHTP
jgi:hypothetical protein